MTLPTRSYLNRAFEYTTKPVVNRMKSWHLGYVLQSYPHIGSAGRFDLSAEIARTNPGFLGRRIQQLNIQSEDDRGKLAEIAADVNLEMIRTTLPNFNLSKGSPYILKIAEKWVRNNPCETEIPFQEYLTDSDIAKLSQMASEIRFEIAKQEITNSQNPQSVDITRHHLSPEQSLELAKLVISRISDINTLASLSLEQYNLSKEQRAELAEIILKKNPFLTTFEIKTLVYGSEEVQNAKKAKTTRLVSLDEESIDPLIQKLEAKADKFRFMEAKKAISQTTNLETFEIEKYRLSEASSFEIAKTIIQKLSNVNAFPVKRYKLNEKDRFEIAKLALERTNNVADFPVGDYLLSQVDRFEFSKMMIEKDPFISDEQIEKITPKETFSHFSLSSLALTLTKLAEDLRFEKAKQFLSKEKAPRDGFSLSGYRIKNKDHLRTLAFTAIETDISYIKYIPAFELEMQDRIQIATIAAQKDGKVLSENIALFAIDDEEKLFAIAIFALSQNKQETAKNIHKFQLQNQKYLNSLFEMVNKKQSAESKKASSQDLSKLTKNELFALKKKKEEKLTLLRNMRDHKGGHSEEKSSAARLYIECENEIKAIEEELRNRKFW